MSDNSKEQDQSKPKRTLKLRTECEEYIKCAREFAPMFEKHGKLLLEAGKLLNSAPDWNASTVDNLKVFLKDAQKLWKFAGIMRNVSEKRGETALKDKYEVDLKELRKGRLLNRV